jgi:ferritin-like metal-binding protein YciE
VGNNRIGKKQAFDDHREQTHEQISRIEQVFELLGKRAQPKTCDAINGLIEDGEDTIDDYGDSPVIDTALVAASTAIEHYEIARYGSLIAWAKQLGIDEAAKLLDANLQEEITAEHLLIQIAQTYADKAADVPNEAGKDPDAEKAADKPVA